MKISKIIILAVTAISWATCEYVAADLTDFTNWYVVQDPADPNFTSAATPTDASLFAGAGAIDVGTDIGFATINESTAANSTAGYVFVPSADFELSIEYNLSFLSASGALGLGFGIGEEVTGENSAGVAFITNNGAPFLNFFGAARVNDNTLDPEDIGLAASLSGRLFIQYDAASGDITLGASQTPGDLTPTMTYTFSNLQDFWNDENLIASFFIRSDAIPVIAPNGWNGGDATAVFSNLRIDGSLSKIPEPGSSLLVSLFILMLHGFRRRC